MALAAILKSTVLIFCLIEISFCYNTEYCATLYSNSENKTFTVKNNQYISNLQETYQSISAWSPIISFQIIPGCSLYVCNETDFSGNCKVFESARDSLPEGFDDLSSASCTCSKECKCSDIHIRNTGCGRAYLNRGCNICNSYYMDLKGSKEVVSLELHYNVSSVMVRSGCTLTMYDEEGFDGEITTLEGITKEEWSGPIRSYECQCDEAKPRFKIVKPRPDNYPEELAIPNNLDAIHEMTSKYGRHPGLMAALKSYKNKRSPKNAYILLLGLTGAGKSSAINLLFDNPNLTKVGGIDSTTTDIHEFRIPVAVDELGITNSELRVIDTPGLCDTRGLEQDARFLATLDDYLSGHEELSHRIPNVVLVFGKFHDNRISGKGAPLVKMLNGLEPFRNRITDLKYSNVIFVLSHYMSMTKDVTRRPTSRLRSFKKVIEQYSLYPKPVSLVVAENKAEEQDLPMLNGYFRLPNGEFYPRNLFDKIQQLLLNGDDPIGESIIRTAFRDSDDFNITAKHFKLVNSDHGKAIRYLRQLIDADFPINNTEVSQILDQAYTGMSNDLKKMYPDSLPYMQHAFNIRKIHQKADIPKTTLEIVQFLKDIKLNEANTYLMDTAFGLKAPVLKENLITAYSYNVLEDKPLPTSPFKLGELKNSDAGYMFPDVMSCELQHETVETLKFFNTREQYLEARLKSLSVDGSVPVSLFSTKPHPGWNIIVAGPIDNNNKTLQTFTALREYRTFDLTLNDRFVLTPEFINTVNSLPPFNSSDFDGIDKWKSFFNSYGTHVVKSAHGGGSIEVQITAEAFSPEIFQGMFELIQFAEDISIGQIKNGGNNTNTTIMGAQYTTFKFRGGDLKYHTSDLTTMTLSAAAELLENWKESVGLSPAILTSDIKLLPISQVAKKISQNVSSEIQRAALMLFNSTLKYIPPSQRPIEIPDDRERTTNSRKSSDFTEFLKIMIENQARADERVQQIILQMQTEAREAEKRREEATNKQREWENKQEVLREERRHNATEAERKRQIEREKLQLDFQEKQTKLREEQEERDRDFRFKELQARKEESERNARLMQELIDKQRQPESCLRKGTKILMAFNSGEKLVEEIKVGDWIMDGNLNPTQVIGISNEFLLDQSFYGFSSSNGSFFTNTHLFIDKDSKIRAVSSHALFEINPLMEYLKVEDMTDAFYVKQAVRDPANGEYNVVSTYTEVQRDPIAQPPSTLVYFLQVDNPEGTYFANGFMARHEIPPFHIWPKTMEAFFTAFEESNAVELVSKVEYTMENVKKINKIIYEIDGLLRSTIQTTCNKTDLTFVNLNSRSQNNFIIKDLEDLDVDYLVGELFNNAALSAFGAGMYGKSGTFIAEHLDIDGGKCFNIKELQVTIVKIIVDELQNHFK